MAVNKVIYDGSTLMDVTDTTAEASDVSSGKVFYSKAGVRTIGTQVPVQSDWNEDDSSAPDYVKNKPLYLENFRNSTVCENKSFSTDLDEMSGKYYYIISNNGGYADTIYIGGTANLVLNGVSYSGSVQSDDEYGNYYVSFGSGSGYSVNVSYSGVIFYSIFGSASGSISLTLPGAELYIDPNYQKLFDDSIGTIPVVLDWNTIDDGQVLGLTYDGWTNIQSVSSVNGQTGDVTLSIPTKTSDLTNDSGYITSSSVPTKTSDLTNDSGFITSSSLPTKTSDLTNDSGYITSSSLPTKTSDLTNDSGFVTTDTNTTYTLSISGNVITLTPSTGTAQTITLPVYNGGVT